MKYSLLLIVAGFFFFSQNINAQLYTPIPTDFARWRVATEVYDGQGIAFVQLNQFILKGDKVTAEAFNTLLAKPF